MKYIYFNPCIFSKNLLILIISEKIKYFTIYLRKQILIPLNLCVYR